MTTADIGPDGKVDMGKLLPGGLHGQSGVVPDLKVAAAKRKTSGMLQRIDAGRSSLFVISAGEGENHARGALEAAADLQLEVAKERLRQEGLENLPGMARAIELKRAQLVDEWEAEVRSRGVALHIQQLLGAPSKGDAIRIAASIAITHAELADFVSNAHAQLGYRHRMKFKEFRPDHHGAFSDQISQALQSAKPGVAPPEMVKAMRKVHALFEERKRVHIHMFEKGAKWHAFFFDFNDLTDPKKGPHVHYVSHRWADLTREIVWDAFDERIQSIPRGVHIRYVEPEMAAAARRRSQKRRLFTSGHVLEVEGRRPQDARTRLPMAPPDDSNGRDQ